MDGVHIWGTPLTDFFRCNVLINHLVVFIIVLLILSFTLNIKVDVVFIQIKCKYCLYYAYFRDK